MTEVVKEMNGGNGWQAGFGGLIGAALGEGGLFGGGNNKTPAVTPDQLQTAMTGLQSQIQGDDIQAALGSIATQVAGLKAGVDSSVSAAVGSLGGAIGGVKDAVVNSNNQTQLSLCNLSHNMTQGFASVNQTVVSQIAGLREQALEQENARLRDKATDLRIELGERKSADLHRDTQTVIQNVVGVHNANTSGTLGQAVNVLGNLAQTVSTLAATVATIQADVRKISG